MAGWPWYLSVRATGCWLWFVTGSALLGLFADAAWWWATAGLCLLALGALARDPQG